MKNVEKCMYTERNYIIHEELGHPVRALYYKKKMEYYDGTLVIEELLGYLLGIVGLLMIILGLLYIVYEGVHDDICNNTKDISYYEKHCINK